MPHHSPVSRFVGFMDSQGLICETLNTTSMHFVFSALCLEKDMYKAAGVFVALAHLQSKEDSAIADMRAVQPHSPNKIKKISIILQFNCGYDELDERLLDEISRNHADFTHSSMKNAHASIWSLREALLATT